MDELRGEGSGAWVARGCSRSIGMTESGTESSAEIWDGSRDRWTWGRNLNGTVTGEAELAKAGVGA